MTLVILACLWVFAATVVAFLPMRRQYIPGVALLASAPVLIGMIVWQYGAIFGLIALAAFLSMFRKPLAYFAKKAVGKDDAQGDKPEGHK